MRRTLAAGLAAALLVAAPPAGAQPASAAAATGSNAAPATATRSAAPSDSSRVPLGLGVPSIPVSRVGGIDVVRANDLAWLLKAARSWNADVRKLVLHSGGHRLTFTDGNPFVIADDHTLLLAHPVFSLGGELQIPVELAQAMPDENAWPRLGYDARAGEMRAAPADGYVGSPRVITRAGDTELVIPTEHPELARVVGRGRARFRLRFRGAFAGVLPDSLPEDGLLRNLRIQTIPGGLSFELAVDPAAGGWRLELAPSHDAVTLTFDRAAGSLEPFAPEPPPGPRPMHTVVLDPGHGGVDTGVQSDGVLEKTLTLDLAKALADELRRRAGAHVLLTRTDDRDLSQLGRAEVANAPKPDLVVSLHFGMSLDPRAKGGAAWCAPASASATVLEAPGAGPAVGAGRTQVAGLLELLPWRDAATAHAVESRALAEDLGRALEHDGFGPMSVRERMPLPLMGVTAPGVLLECGTLSNVAERARILAPNGIHLLASAIADGLLAWQRGE